MKRIVCAANDGYSTVPLNRSDNEREHTAIVLMRKKEDGQRQPDRLTGSSCQKDEAEQHFEAGEELTTGASGHCRRVRAAARPSFVPTARHLAVRSAHDDTKRRANVALVYALFSSPRERVRCVALF